MDHGFDDALWKKARLIATRQLRGASAQEREDLAHDLVVAALEARDTPQRAGAWLERVGRHATIDRWRRQRRWDAVTSRIQPCAGPPDPEATLLARERRDLVRRAVATLPRPQRRAALLRFGGELPFAAVAARLGTPVVTARTRLARALSRLRTSLSGLRSWFVWPGAPATALGLALVAVEAPGLAWRAAPPAELNIAPPARPTRFAQRATAPRPVPAAPAPAVADANPAEPRRQRRAAQGDAPPAEPRPQVFSYDDDQVEGELRRPDDFSITALPQLRHSSLIELRRQFLPEMLKSLEEL